MDGNLKPVTVLAANSTFLGSRDLCQFNNNGPIFTPEHQFYIDLSLGQVTVVSRPALFIENPQLEERVIFEMHECPTVLCFDGKEVVKAPFELKNHGQLDPSTVVYFIITSGRDGSYIANGFVSRHELPDFQAWPMTYGTLGLILASCQIDFPVDTIAKDNILASEILDLVKLWKLTLVYYESDVQSTDFDADEIGCTDDVNNVLAMSSEMLANIVNNQCKMKVAQYLNMFGAKVLHDFLENDKIAVKKRMECAKTIVIITQNYFQCTFPPTRM